ncbi:hypothetical protein LLH03_00340 [bacterium]|nr:hypothetical protein [bacterium]
MQPDMICRALLTAACLMGLCLPGGAATLKQTDTAYVFANNRLSLTLDKTTGAWTELRLDGALVGKSDPGWQSFDLRQESDWLTGSKKATPRLLEVVQEVSDALRVKVALGQWTLDFSYRLGTPETLLTRSVALTWTGTQQTKLKGFWLGTPQCPATPDSYYYFPGSYPPDRRTASQFAAGQQRSTGKSLCPLIAQITPALSALWISDTLTPDSDRGSAVVKESAGSFGVTQSFDSQGIVKPQTTQRIGDACLWLLPTDGEQCLYRIHDWMRLRGHVPPADRPQWFREAILYSFHPGGTIGSGLKDLGGFRPATAFLDQIATLGANSLWIMPIEDVSLYNPRDYYKFQEGLGTAEEYRTLVSRSHQLGLHVLQDCVPHGGSNTFPRAKEHPEWLAYDEDGSTLGYWCFDFNWPTWREYMAGVARYYVSQFGVDGYRVDAVSGSRIPNWNPNIPYGRASFAQLQGGLNMLRSLRAAVKAEKPVEGGLLAETEGSVYGTVSDAVYDFTGCYTVYHDLRRLPAPDFVSRLRRWLHEQQYAETPDLLRLRHMESHDSLRSALWYGLEPQHALMALTSWIHGIPLIYHEAETGSTATFRRIFAIRKSLPELQGGAADYFCIQTPPEVFSCLRTQGEDASVVLINFSGAPVKGEAVVPAQKLPDNLRGQARVRDLWTGALVTGQTADGSLRLPVSLQPLQFTVCALRTGEAVPALPTEDWWTPTPATTSAAAAPVAEAVQLSGKGYTGWIDRKTGLLARFEASGTPVLGAADLFLPADLAGAPAEVTVEAAGSVVTAYRKYPEAMLRLTYRVREDGLEVAAQWTGKQAPGEGSLGLPVPAATHWFASSAEGLAQDEYHPRHLTIDGATGSIYRKPQGTNVVWDSLLHPLGDRDRCGAVGAKTGGKDVSVSFEEAASPARVELLDHVGDRHELTALIALRRPDVAEAPETEVRFTLSPQGPQPIAPQRLRPVAGGWEFENDSYYLRLGRSGTITELRTRGENPQVVISGADVYTDRGFTGEKMTYDASNDVEASAWFCREDGATHLRFEGQVRGFGRFDLLKPPIDYALDYTLGEGPSFRLTCAVRPQAAPIAESAFLSHRATLPEVREFTFSKGGVVLAQGDIGDGSVRVGQTAQLTRPQVPDQIVLRSAAGPLLRLEELQCGGARSISNVFLHSRNFFLTWYDGPVEAAQTKGWSYVSALWTPGAAKSVAVRKVPTRPDAGEPDSLLQDPGFESALGGSLKSVVRGETLPVRETPTGWSIPSGGRAVSSPVHSGRAAAEVVNTSGGYLLWRQALPLGKLPVGSTWRLSAWVKGEGIVRGDPSWKVGCIRFGVQTNQMQYFSCPELLGTFDWKQVSVEVTIPQGAVGVNAEVGLNGALGKLWVDEVKLERVK